MKSFKVITIWCLVLLLTINPALCAKWWGEPDSLTDRSTWVAENGEGSGSEQPTNESGSEGESGSENQEPTPEEPTPEEPTPEEPTPEEPTPEEPTPEEPTPEEPTPEEPTPEEPTSGEPVYQYEQNPSRCSSASYYQPSCPCKNNCWFTTTVENTCNAEKCGNLLEMVAVHEGKRYCMYYDQVGVETIAIGFNLRRHDAPGLIQQLGYNYNSVLNGSQCITDDDIYFLLNNDIGWAKTESRQCVSNFDSHSKCIQNLMIDMTFNLGGPTFCGWNEVVKNLEGKHYDEAIAAMEKSQWCQIVQSRCTHLTNILRNCRN